MKKFVRGKFVADIGKWNLKGSVKDGFRDNKGDVNKMRFKKNTRCN